ncbi:MAG: hypothetical protein IJU29_00735 [Oscillospiraceae bacterium]|nr:hypothetical protein [Oscillospiraceae bacterium]
MNREQQMYREIYDSLHASAKTRQEVFNMQNEKKTIGRTSRRALTGVLAAVLTVALAIGVLAAAGIFNMNIREAEPEERFYTDFTLENGRPFYWDGAKLVFSFDGPQECSAIRVKPGWMPYRVNEGFSLKAEDGWYSRISCEGSDSGGESNQPCLIELRYAPMFVDGGNLLLLYADDAGEIVEDTWKDWNILKFGTHYANSNFPDGSHDVDCSYYMMYQPDNGWIITVSSMENNPDTLEKIGQALEIDVTEDSISSADYQGHSEFFDCGVG